MRLTTPRIAVPLLALMTALSLAAPASAQALRVGGTIAYYPGGTIRGTDTGYDPKNDVYLLVQGYGPLYGVFVNASGKAVTPMFTIQDGSTGFGQFPRAVYCPDLSNGAGGSGAFLVLWDHNTTANSIQGRIVALEMPGYLVTGPQMISDLSQASVFFENRPVAAYSPTSKRFLVAWTTISPAFGLQGRFVDTNGTPTGAVIRFEEGGARDPDLVWNPQTNEFGMINTGWGGSGAFAVFRRIRASDGGISGKSTFGYAAGTYATGIDLNSSSQYVLAWALMPGTRTAIFDLYGNPLSGSTGNYVSGRIGGDQSLGLSFNPNSNSTLVVSSDWNTLEVAAAELYSNGEPKSSVSVVTDGALTKGSFYPLTDARTRSGANEWDVVYSRDFKGLVSQIVGSGSPGATPSSPAPAPAPTPAPTPTPAPSSGSCSTADPFKSLGGGVCCNGGWRPPGMSCGTSSTTTTPTPAPTTSSTCRGSDPFTSLGGGTCCNGGWIPRTLSCSAPSSSTAPAPAPTTSSCAGSDPFTSTGGGVCVNGGWIPASMACGGKPDPFVSIGGGKCVNGGWVPKSM